ncbi:MAG: aspartate-semialdehyde dehydrogenase, partial [Bacteroidales bacterium]|nr:aspartate-semialdehyde dehydrogenase [Bacteroidales bacterium]
MKIALVGATGLVGSEMLKMLEVLHQRHPFTLIAAASERSIGKKISFLQQEISVMSVEKAIEQQPEFAVFSAGAAASEQYAPTFAANGTTVVDNSSAWRMHPDIPLIVPEINAGQLNRQHKIIANPNCSTIQMVIALHPLHQHYGI